MRALLAFVITAAIVYLTTNVLVRPLVLYKRRMESLGTKLPPATEWIIWGTDMTINYMWVLAPLIFFLVYVLLSSFSPRREERATE